MLMNENDFCFSKMNFIFSELKIILGFKNENKI